MPRIKKAKQKTEEVESKLFQESYPKTVFVDKYRAAGYNVSCTDGVLMFSGNYDIKNIRKMVHSDGYLGSYGVREVRS